MTEEKDKRRRRRAGLLLGLLAFLGVSILIGAALAPAADTPPLRVNATPTTIALTAGESGTYDITLSRGSERSMVAFTAADLPPAATASFSPATTVGDTTKLTITTDGDDRDGTVTPAGTYDIVLRATGSRSVAGTLVRLKVQKQAIASLGDVVRVSGTLGTVLRPGAGASIDATLTNPSRTAVRINSVSVTLSGLTAPNATAARPCTLADFEMVGYSGPAFTLTPGESRSFSQLGIPAAQWPQVRMRNTSVNQDGCQRATVTWTYNVEGRTS